jgi:hypothetical protein
LKSQVRREDDEGHHDGLEGDYHEEGEGEEDDGRKRGLGPDELIGRHRAEDDDQGDAREGEDEGVGQRLEEADPSRALGREDLAKLSKVGARGKPAGLSTISCVDLKALIST